MIKNKIKKNKACPFAKRDRGFVLLFSILISNMLLMIALGMVSIAYKEIRFGTSAKDSNEAFFAADAGVECVLYNDKNTSNSFKISGLGTVNCLSKPITITQLGTSLIWDFNIAGLGSNSTGCVKVNVDKQTLPGFTKITSIGYNSGGSDIVNNTCLPGINSLERRLDLTY